MESAAEGLFAADFFCNCIYRVFASRLWTSLQHRLVLCAASFVAVLQIEGANGCSRKIAMLLLLLGTLVLVGVAILMAKIGGMVGGVPILSASSY
jgi:hypothetical protein